MIVLPKGTITRWQEADTRESILAWRALSKWMLAEAHLACSEGRISLASDLFLLADVAMARALDLQPEREAA